jgi:hypothetical protein
MNKFHENTIAEIQFWKDLIRASGSSIPQAERKRMEHAMLFAQMKLLKFEHETTKHANKPLKL